MGAKTISVSAVAKAPAEVVWDLITDIERAPDRLADVVSIDWLSSDSGFQVGTRWRQTRRIMGKEATEEMWVTALDGHSGYVVAAEPHGIHYRSGYELTDAGDSARIRLEFSGE